MSNKNLMELDSKKIIELIPNEKKELIRDFVHEMNRREYEVRFQKKCNFDTFKHLENEENKFGYGFIVDNKSVPYFHPNRSFHDEIIWLNNNVFYNPDCTFEDKLINAAIVKFYGPSNTISLITKDTDSPFIKYNSLVNDYNYVQKCMVNLENARKQNTKIYGTTELRTSLQTESRNYCREINTPYDDFIKSNFNNQRKGRASDIVYWFTYLGPKFVEFYKSKPSMEQSFDFLTSIRGIGNYYGYHFSTNLARMPEIGTELLLKNSTNKFGNLDEDDDFVAPGVGAMSTINWFYKDLGVSVSTKVGAKVIQAIRDNQNEFFNFKGESLNVLNEITEIGRFTTFGVEISCCQFSVYLRLKNNKNMALRRASAPISKEGLDNNEEISQLKLF
jgi:hypothetical protein